MNPTEFFLAVLTATSIPSALTGFLIWNLQRRIEQRDKAREEANKEYRQKREEREKRQEEGQLLLQRGVDASIALGEATARAVQRIPDAHCNGDMHAALEYATAVKHERKNWLTERAVNAVY